MHDRVPFNRGLVKASCRCHLTKLTTAMQVLETLKMLLDPDTLEGSAGG